MSTEEEDQREREAREQQAEGAEQITNELAHKYDPERLLGMVSKRAGRGQSLDQSIRSRYERRFGVDLSHVRVYTGEFAEDFNKQRQAHAVTIGSTGMILMGGSPDRAMHSAAGQALLAHELTHVAQASRGLHRKSYDDAMPFAGEQDHEAHAEHVEAEVHAEEGGGGLQTVYDLSAKLAEQEAYEEKIEEIKERAKELFADAFRNQASRTGSSRRH